MAAVQAIQPPDRAARAAAEQRAALVGLQAREALAQRIQGHLETKAGVAKALAELQAQRCASAADEVRRLSACFPT